MGKPKAPMTGYFRFVNSIRAQVQEETGLKGTAATKVFGERWAELPEEQKEALKAEYTAEYAEYKKKLDEYKKTDTYAAFQKKNFKRKFKKAPKDKNAPKKPLSAYFIFLAEKRASLKAEFRTEHHPARKEIGRYLEDPLGRREISLQSQAHRLEGRIQHQEGSIRANRRIQGLRSTQGRLGSPEEEGPETHVNDDSMH